MALKFYFFLCAFRSFLASSPTIRASRPGMEVCSSDRVCVDVCSTPTSKRNTKRRWNRTFSRRLVFVHIRSGPKRLPCPAWSGEVDVSLYLTIAVVQDKVKVTFSKQLKCEGAYCFQFLFEIICKLSFVSCVRFWHLNVKRRSLCEQLTNTAAAPASKINAFCIGRFMICHLSLFDR